MHAMVQDGENILAGTTNDPWLRGVHTYLQARLHIATRRCLVHICCSMHRTPGSCGKHQRFV